MVRFSSGISSSKIAKGSGWSNILEKLQLRCRSRTQISSTGRRTYSATDMADASARMRFPRPFFALMIT